MKIYGPGARALRDGFAAVMLNRLRRFLGQHRLTPGAPAAFFACQIPGQILSCVPFSRHLFVHPLPGSRWPRAMLKHHGMTRIAYNVSRKSRIFNTAVRPANHSEEAPVRPIGWRSHCLLSHLCRRLHLLPRGPEGFGDGVRSPKGALLRPEKWPPAASQKNCPFIAGVAAKMPRRHVAKSSNPVFTSSLGAFGCLGCERRAQQPVPFQSLKPDHSASVERGFLKFPPSRFVFA